MHLKIFKPCLNTIFPFSKIKSLSPSLLLSRSFFLSTPKLHSHYLASPPELRCQTSPIPTRPTFVSSENPKIVSPSHCFQPRRRRLFPHFQHQKSQEGFLVSPFLFIFCIFHILFVCFSSSRNYKGQSFYDD